MGRDERFIHLAKRSARLNARPWSEVRAGNPDWHPRNDEGEEGEPETPEAKAQREKAEAEAAQAEADRKAAEEHEVDVAGMDPGEIGKRLGRAEAENQRLKRAQAEREKEHRKAQAQAKAVEDQRKAEQGEWKKLAEERADRVLELESELRELKTGIEEGKRRDKVEAIADKVGFHNPKRAYAILREEMAEDKLAETLENDALIDAALRRVAKAEPYLVDATRRTGTGMPGRNGGKAKDPATEHNELVAALLGGGAQQIQ